MTTSTSGAEPDPDGYTVQVDGAPPQAVGSAATIQIAEVESGSHTVHLAGLALNCTVAENPLTTSVTAGQTIAVTFAVTCEATTGSIQITSTTTGPSPDADGYTVTVDGAERGALGTSAAINVDALPTGNHVVALSSVAANCQVQGDNPRTVAVTGGVAATVAFAVTCAEPPPSAGTLRITTATTGADRDPNGYTIMVDGGAPQPIGVNAAVSLTNLAGGSHTVQLGGLAPNCSAQGTNPRPATVTAGGTAEVGFAITCTATTGTIRVSVSTTGSQIDPNGYTAKLDGSGTGKRVTATGSVTFTGASAGNHTIVLSDVASNCTVADGTSRSAAVATGATVDVSFAVSCTATTGTIRVTVTSSGTPADPDGFTVKLDQNGPTRSIPGSGGSADFTSATAGTHTVALTGMASNCSVPDGASKSVTVQAGATADVAFTVACSATGEAWATIPLPPGFRATALWVYSASFLFVAGSYPNTLLEAAIVHYDGSKWIEQFRGEGIYERAAFWGRLPTDVFAVVGSGMVLQHQFGDWMDVGPQDEDLNYASIWPSSGQLFAGGFVSAIPENGLLSHFDGSTWTVQPPGGHGYGSNGLVNDLSGVSPTDVYALGETSPSGQDPEEQYTEYRVERYNGSSWSLSFAKRTGDLHPDGYSLHGLWANASDDVFVVGSGGHIDHYNGTAWSPMISPTTGNLADVWGNSASNVYAVGDAGILHYNGGSWSVIDPRAARRVWGTEEEVFVLTQDAVLHADH